MSSSSQPVSRFQFVDGLRGLAALAVIVPHAVGLFAFRNANWFSRLIMSKAATAFAASGVEVFFVVSGFAIAYSLRNADAEGFTLGRFVLRRAVRLDPPYWAGLLLVGGVNVVRAVITHQHVSSPAPEKVLAHLFYLQDLLHYKQFNIVFWTLCLEFQLYLVFAALIRAMCLSVPVRSETGVHSTAQSDRKAQFLVFVFVLSVLVSHVLWSFEKKDGWFVPFFYLFLAGALASWQKLGRISDKTFVLCLVLMAVGLAWSPSAARLFGLLTAGAIYIAGRRHALSRWLSGRTFQWLGRISYSIYLVHVPVVFLMMGLRARVAPGSNIVSFIAFAGVYGLTLCVAHVFHLAIEVPFIRLSQRLKQSGLPTMSPVPPTV